MQKAALIASMFLFTLPLSAGSAPTGPQPEGRPPVFVRSSSGMPGLKEVMAKLRQDRPGTSAASGNSAGRAVLIPLLSPHTVLSTRTYSTAEYTLVLPRLRHTTEQRVAFYWIPVRAAAGFESGSLRLGNPVTTSEPALGWDDFDYFPGTGAALFVPLDENGDPDPHGAIDANSRLSNYRGVGLGEFSVAVPGIDAGGLFSGNEAWIYGTRMDVGYSTYYGIVNLGDTDLTFDIIGDPDAGAWAEHLGRVTVRTGAMIFQRLLPYSRSYTVVGLQHVGQHAASWTAFAITTDHASGDGWFSMASSLPPRTR
jgi:hypothetical protein